MDLGDKKTNTVFRRNFEENKKMIETEAFWVMIAEELTSLHNIINHD